jgi:hypothetical protein
MHNTRLKGLEYPCVYCGCGKSSGFLTESKAGKIPRWACNGLLRLRRRIKYPSYIKTALSREQNYEQVREEINTLYVAMTRAKYRLYICGAADIIKFAPLYGVYGVKNTDCYFDFIFNMLLRDGKNAGQLGSLYCGFDSGLDYEFNNGIPDAQTECGAAKETEKKEITPLTDYKHINSTF